MEHGRLHARVDPQHDPARFQARKQIIKIGRVGHGLQEGELPANRFVEKLLPRLRMQTVEQPGIARRDPMDQGRGNPRVQQPSGSVHRGFSRAQNHIGARRGPCLQPKMGQGVWRNQAHARLHLKLRDMCGGGGGFQKCRVNNFAPDRDVTTITGKQGAHLARADMFCHRQIAHTPGHKQAVAHDAIEIGQDFRT